MPNSVPQFAARPGLGEILLRPVAWLASLVDYVLSPLQTLIGYKRMAYFFVLPNMLIFGIFILLPMILNFFYAFTSGDSILLEARPNVGFENLDKLFTCQNFAVPNSCVDDLFWRAVWNTAGFVIAQVAAIVIISLISALALNRDVRGRGFFRAMFFYPVLLSPVVVALIWKWILQKDYGLLNAFLSVFGIDKVGWLLDPRWSQFWVIAVSVWAQMGFFTLILLAGLQAIPKEMYEAASMDGANKWSSFWNVTLPLLMPTMTVVLILSLIRAVQVFDQVFVLTNGGPGTATLYIIQYIYRTAFEFHNYGMASAASLVLAVVLFALTIGQLILQRRQEAV